MSKDFFLRGDESAREKWFRQLSLQGIVIESILEGEESVRQIGRMVQLFADSDATMATASCLMKLFRHNDGFKFEDCLVNAISETAACSLTFWELNLMNSQKWIIFPESVTLPVFLASGSIQGLRGCSQLIVSCHPVRHGLGFIDDPGEYYWVPNKKMRSP